VRARRDGKYLVWEDPVTLHEMRLSWVGGGNLLIRDEENGACVWLRASDADTVAAWLADETQWTKENKQ
jgi:hypothetical protein